MLMRMLEPGILGIEDRERPDNSARGYETVTSACQMKALFAPKPPARPVQTASVGLSALNVTSLLNRFGRSSRLKGAGGILSVQCHACRRSRVRADARTAQY